MNKMMIKNKNNKEEKITKTGLLGNLPSMIRTEKLKKIALDRGQRLRQIRTILGYNLDYFSELLGINQGTLGRLERGDTCISIDMGKWIVKRLIENGMMLNVEWLITGKGFAPQQIKSEEFSIKDTLSDILSKNKNIDVELQDNIPILISVLCTKLISETHKSVLSTYVKDNKMSPIYEKGEFVMGIISDNIDEYNGKICIIVKKGSTLTTSIKLIRKISVIEENNQKIILAIPYNILSDHEEVCKIINNDYIIAPIIFKYNDSMDSNNNKLKCGLDEYDLSRIENLVNNNISIN